MANEGLLYCIDVLPHCLASMFPCQHDTTAASCQNNVFIQIKMTGAETVVPLASQSERKTLTQIFFHKWQCLVSSFNGERQRRLCPFGALLASGCSPQGKNRRGLHTPSEPRRGMKHIESITATGVKESHSSLHHLSCLASLNWSEEARV